MSLDFVVTVAHSMIPSMSIILDPAKIFCRRERIDSPADFPVVQYSVSIKNHGIPAYLVVDMRIPVVKAVES